MRTDRWIKQAALATGLSLALAGPVQAGWGDLLNQAGDMAGDMVKGMTGEQGGDSAAGSLGSALSQGEISDGLKEALAQGVNRAVTTLGKSGGFLRDEAVRIPMPSTLGMVEKSLRGFGQQQLADNFVETLNSAAEQAVPATADLLAETVRNMSLEDARRVLQGGENSATEYFRERNETQLRELIMPQIRAATEQAGVTGAYKALMGQLRSMDSFGISNFIPQDITDLDSYVAEKTLDGLFVKIADEEKRIRENPVARSTDLLKKVFENSI